jgi:hypothetical protein
VPFAYASNVKTNLESLRNLPFKVKALHKSDISGDLSRNISVVPNPQFPFNTALLTTSNFRDPLDSSSLDPTCSHFTCPMARVFVHGYHYVFDNGE